MEEVYEENLLEGLEEILDVKMEEVVGLADEWREAVKAEINMELKSSGSSPEENKKEERKESESDAEGSEV